MEQLTDKEAMIFSILDYVGDDMETAGKVVGFIGDSRVKYQLFTRCYAKIGEGSVSEKSAGAIIAAESLYKLFSKPE